MFFRVAIAIYISKAIHEGFSSFVYLLQHWGNLVGAGNKSFLFNVRFWFYMSGLLQFPTYSL